MLGRLATNLDLKCDLMTRWGRGNFILEFCETKTNVTNRHQSKFMWSSIFPISYFNVSKLPFCKGKMSSKMLSNFYSLGDPRNGATRVFTPKVCGITSCRVVKSSWLSAKIATYFISIGLVSYSAWHFFTDGVFRIKYLWIGRLLWQHSLKPWSCLLIAAVYWMMLTTSDVP